MWKRLIRDRDAQEAAKFRPAVTVLPTQLGHPIGAGKEVTDFAEMTLVESPVRIGILGNGERAVDLAMHSVPFPLCRVLRLTLQPLLY